MNKECCDKCKEVTLPPKYVQCNNKMCHCHLAKASQSQAKDSWQKTFLDAGTANSCGDLSIMIGVVSGILAEEIRKAEESAMLRQRNYDQKLIDSARKEGAMAENKEWREGRRCEICGKENDSNLSSMCGECFENG